MWTDETSVVLGQRRGSHPIWRTLLEGEKPVTSTVRERYYKATEFMFQASFSSDWKRLCHCWEKETAAKKKEATTKIAAMNAAIKPEAQAEWELSTAANRLRLDSNVPGRKPQQNFTKENGAYIRDSKGGINWWRYRIVILEPLLIPFTLECNKKRALAGQLPMIVQEDKAPLHNSKYQAEVFSLHEILRLLLPRNFPDLNMIEPCWP